MPDQRSDSARLFAGETSSVAGGGRMSAKKTRRPLVARLRPVGVIRSTLRRRSLAPRQGSEGAPDAWLDIDAWAAEALDGLHAGDEIIVITWFHQSRRDVFRVHPRSDERNPLTGVFATRSPDRPNTLGLHPVVVRAIKGTRQIGRASCRERV